MVWSLDRGFCALCLYFVAFAGAFFGRWDLSGILRSYDAVCG